MNRLQVLLSALALTMVSTVFMSEAQAQATRTWVSGVGDDANPCSRTAPCKTFAGAISKTATNGLISVLDPGGFGAVTITKSITIDGAGTIASILSPATSGVIVNGANVRVVLRNIDIDGASNSTMGLYGIRFLQGSSLQVENVAIRNITGGVDPTCIAFYPSGTARLFLDNVNISNCGTGSATGGGIVVKPTGGGSKNILINNTRVSNSSRGVVLDGNGNTGGMFASIVDSKVFINAGAGIQATGPAAGGGTIDWTVSATTSANNTPGSLVNGASADVRLGGSTITGNTTGVSVTSGELFSFKNNEIAGNTNNGTPIVAVPGGPLN